MVEEKFTRQGVRDLNLIGPRPPKKERPGFDLAATCQHEWMPEELGSVTIGGEDSVYGHPRFRNVCHKCGALRKQP